MSSIAATAGLSITQSFQPFLNLGFACADFVAVDGKAFGDGGLGEGFLHVADTVGQAAALVGGEGNDGLAVKFDVLEEREHHLRDVRDRSGANVINRCPTTRDRR